MRQKPVSFAIISPGRWGRRLLDATRDSTKLHFAGVWSRDPQNATDIVTHYGGHSFPSFEALLSDDTVEAVLLPTPHFLHYPQAMVVLEAGKHVFVEKPIANTIAEALAMQNASRQRGLVLSVGHQGRRAGSVRKAKAMMERGDLGSVAMVAATHGFPLALNYQEGDWETSAEKMPGGPLDQLGIHYMDTMQYLLGPIKRVSGFTNRHITPFAISDAVTTALEFERGVVGAYATHMVSSGVSQLTVYGTRGALHINRFGQELLWQELQDTQTAKTSGPTLQPLDFPGPHPFSTALTEELEEFADCIRLGRRPEVGAPEAITALRVVRAIMESSESGKAVEVSLDKQGGKIGTG